MSTPLTEPGTESAPDPGTEPDTERVSLGDQIFRGVLILLGLAAMARGASLVLHMHFQFLQYRSIVFWLAAGSVLHDGLIAPASLLLGRVLRRPLLGPVTGNAARAAWLALGAVVIIGLPLIGGSGKIPFLGGTGHRNNPTVIPGRPLLNITISLALLVGGAVLVAGFSRLRQRRR